MATKTTTKKATTTKKGATARAASTNDVTISGKVYHLSVYSDKVMSFSLGITHLTPTNKNYMTFVKCKAFLNNDDIGLADGDIICIMGSIDTESYTNKKTGDEVVYNYINVTDVDYE